MVRKRSDGALTQPGLIDGTLLHNAAAAVQLAKEKEQSARDASAAAVAQAQENIKPPEGVDWVSQPEPTKPQEPGNHVRAANALIADVSDKLTQSVEKAIAKHAVRLNAKGLQRLVVSIGSETYAPVAYNSFTVGAITCEFEVAADETVLEVYNRASVILAEMNHMEFESSLGRYMGHLQAGADAIRARAEANARKR